jgi:hypothetical protein
MPPTLQACGVDALATLFPLAALDARASSTTVIVAVGVAETMETAR